MKLYTALLIIFFYSGGSIAQDRDQPAVDFKNATVDVKLQPYSQHVIGKVTYEAIVLFDTDSINIDAKNLVDYKVSSTTHPNIKASLSSEGLLLEDRFRESENLFITINYTSQPRQALYFIDQDHDGLWDQAWTQGQGKNTSSWLPTIDDPVDKMVWDINITAPSDLKVISNGSLKSRIIDEERSTWSYDMNQPMSSYLVAIAVGNYKNTTQYSDGGVPIDLFYYPQDSAKVSSTYQHTLEIFNQLEREIGVAYPWQNYKQVPVKDFLYAGMENTTATLFDDQFVQDDLGAVDRSYVNVNAHELAHQWFGNLVTAQSSKDHWLQEGLATYYALLVQGHIYGQDYFNVQLYEQVELLEEQNQSGKGTSLLDPSANSLTFYQHGAWAAHALRHTVGDIAFKNGMQNYLKEYAFKTATTQDLLEIISAAAGINLDNFKSTWLTNKLFPTQDALQILEEDEFMQNYLQLVSRRLSSFEDSRRSYDEVLQGPLHKELALEVVRQLANKEGADKNKYLEKIAASQDTELRQLIALTTKEVNNENKELVTSFFTDPSYLTREQSLVLLWNAANNKVQLLNTALKAWGRTNESLKMAWLALAINTVEYSSTERNGFLKELREYTSSYYSTNTRQIAFDYLMALNYLDEQNILDLYHASLHHNYRFYQYARDLVDQVYQKEIFKKSMEQVLLLLDPDDQEKLRLVTDL